MGADERFPKPVIPWFHEMEGRRGWLAGKPDSVVRRHHRGWVVTADPGIGPRCGFETAAPDDWERACPCCVGLPLSCGLPPGHDGPHMATCRNRRVASLRRAGSSRGH